MLARVTSVLLRSCPWSRTENVPSAPHRRPQQRSEEDHSSGDQQQQRTGERRSDDAGDRCEGVAGELRVARGQPAVRARARLQKEVHAALHQLRLRRTN